MRLLSAQTRANEVPNYKNKCKCARKHKVKGKIGCKAHEQRQLRLLSTQTRAKEIHKQKFKGKLCCKALLSTRLSINDVDKHKNKGKRG